MRPDKKGSKKRDERRHGHKTGPQRPCGPQKPAGAVEKPSAVAAATTDQSAVATQGPRILEPAAPQSTETDRYRRRQIRSNWHRYQQEPSHPTDQHFLRGDTFAELLAASAGEAGHFQLLSERSWLEPGGGVTISSSLLMLDGHRTHAALSPITLNHRLGIDLCHFTEDEVEWFSEEQLPVSDTPAAQRGRRRTTAHGVAVATSSGESSGQSALSGQSVPPGHSALSGQSVLPGHSALSGQSAPPGQSVPPGHSALSGQSAPPEQSVLPGHSAPPGQSVPPGQSTPPEQSALPGHSTLSRQSVPPGQWARSGESVEKERPQWEPAAGAVRRPQESAGVTTAQAAAPALLQDDWLDSVLSDED